jgi:hypothetical protein
MLANKSDLNVGVKDLTPRLHSDSILTFSSLNFISQKCLLFVYNIHVNLNMIHIDETSQRF